MRSSSILFLVGAMSLAACSSSGSDTGLGSSSANATAEGAWCHDQLQATDGTTMRLDYMTNMVKSTSGQAVDHGMATPAWLNVQRWGFTGNESVTVVVIQYEYSSKQAAFGPPSNTPTSVRNVNLTWDSNNQKFTGQAPDLMLTQYIEGDDQVSQFRYEFAFEIDGTWLVDPISQGHNFGYDPPKEGPTTACRGSNFNG